MTDYKAIFGKKIKFLTSDLSAAEAEGEIFYSDTDAKFKVAVATAAWSAGSALSTARSKLGGTGTITASLAFGSSTQQANTEEYNGTGWATGGNLGTGKYFGAAGIGTQTAALACGGYPYTNEEYNGSTWTEVAESNTNRFEGACFGIQTAGVLGPGNPDTNATEEYDGSSWTASNDCNTARRLAASAGILTAGIIAGGNPPFVANVEEYDGTSWTEAGSLNTARGNADGAGVQTDGIFIGGSKPALANESELWDGTSATASATLSTARTNLAASGTTGAKSTGAVAFGGGVPGASALTEEFNVTAMTVTAGAWASGGNLNNSTHEGRAGAGSQTAAVVWGGYLPSPSSVTVDTEEYDGSSWTETANLPIGVWNSAGFGTQTAAVSAGGGWNEQGEAGIFRDETKEYDGSSWSNGNDMNENRTALSGTGTLTAGLGVAGYRPGATPAYLAFTEEYDGTNWTAGGALPGARGYGGAAGTQTAALYMGSYTAPPATRHDESFEYDGSSWTDGGEMLVGRSSFASMQQGTQTDALIAGGSEGTATQVISEGYDGTSWSTRPTLASSIESAAGAGTAAAGLTIGSSSSPRARTFEFTGATTAETASTIDFD